MNKVYTGETPIKEHIEQLDIKGWIPHEQRKPKKQSFEIQRLKRESGLTK